MDVEIRFGEGENPESGLISVEDATDGVLRLAEVVDELLPDAICGLLGMPARTQEPTTVWLTAADHDLHHLLRLSKYTHDVTEQPITAGQLDMHRYEGRARRDAVESWLSTMLLDDGIRDAEVLAADIMARLPDDVDPKPWC